MQTEEFVEEVRMNVLRNHALRLSERETWRAIQSTLQTLSEQLSPDHSDFIAERLPSDVAEYMQPSEADEALTVEEFLDRVAELEAVDTTVASYYVRAVLETVSQTLDDEELEELKARLPARFGQLFVRGAGDELEMSL